MMLTSLFFLSSLLFETQKPKINTNAIGLLEVFPSSDHKKVVRCTAFHIGDGLVVSAGHCFLGTMGCNNARVWFALNRDTPRPNPSKCTKVVYSSAKDKSDDLVLFKVDNVPKNALELEPLTNDNSTIKSGSANTLYSYLENYTLQNQENCVIFRGPVVDAFGRSRRSHSALLTRCSADSFGHGGPVISDAGKVIGVYQSPLYFPSLEKPNNLTLSFLSGISDLVNIVQDDRISFPKTIHIGGFTPETFPNALPDNLFLEVANIKNGMTENGSFTAAFKTSPTSSFIITDARQTRFTIGGLQDERTQKPIRLFPPVQIYLKTGKDIFSVNSSIDFKF